MSYKEQIKKTVLTILMEIREEIDITEVTDDDKNYKSAGGTILPLNYLSCIVHLRSILINDSMKFNS